MQCLVEAVILQISEGDEGDGFVYQRIYGRGNCRGLKIVLVAG